MTRSYTDVFLDITHRSNIENIIFYGHDDGSDNSIHSFKIMTPIDEEKSCKLEKSCLEKVSDFRTTAKDYYEDIPHKRFPPSYYLADSPTKRFGDLFEMMHTSPNTRILTGYNVIKHLEMLGFEDKDFVNCSINRDWIFENTVTVLVPESSLILCCVVVDGKDTDVVKSELEKCNDLMKAVYVANQKNISNQNVTVVGTIVLPLLTRKELQTKNLPFLNIDNTNTNHTGTIPAILVSKEELASKDSLQDWWNSICFQIKELLGIRLQQQKHRQRQQKEKQQRVQQQTSRQATKTVAGEMMTSMSIICSYLPKVTYDTGEKIATLLINPSQVDVILDESPWKVITGHFGSGKSICLKEIARRLYCRNDGYKIFYICFDPYSLIEAEIAEYFQSLSKEGQLQSLSLNEISLNAGYSVDQFYNCVGPPKRNIAEIFQYLLKVNGQCHLLVDEFHVDNVNKQYCDELKQCLEEHFKKSTVVIATQSMTTTKQVIEDDKIESFTKCSLHNAGMKMLPLTKALRMPSIIFYLTQIAIDEIEDNEVTLPLSSNQDETPIVHYVPLKTVTRTATSGDLDQASNTSDEDAIFETSDVQNSKSSINIYKLHDPQMIVKMNLSSLPTNTTRKMTTKFQFVYGECGAISGDITPQLIFLPDEFSIESSQSCRIFTEILKQLVLNTGQKVSFICKDVKEIVAIKYTLRILGFCSITYAPYLLGQLPNNEEKCELNTRLHKEVNTQLITDHRSFRGCETSHCVFFIDPNEKYGNNVLIEVMTRATSRLDIFVYPSLKSENEVTSCLSKIITAWSKEDLIDKLCVRQCIRNKHTVTICWDDVHYDVIFTKTELDDFKAIQKSVENERKFHFDKRKAFE